MGNSLIQLLSLEEKIRIYTLAEEIIFANGGLIITDVITTTPCYLGEEKWKGLIDTISHQKGDFLSVIYLNGFREKFSENVYKKMLTTVRKYAKKDKRILIIGHLYDEKPTIGAIRADMIDAIVDSIDTTKVLHSKIIGLDADTYKLDDDYIVGMAKQLDNVHGFVSGELRWYDEHMVKGDEWAFILERLFVFAMAEGRKKTNEVCFPGGSFGVKLSDYKRVGGFNRSLIAGEDLQLGMDLGKIGIKGYIYDGKVYVDPRRGQDAINQRKSDERGKKGFGTLSAENFTPLPSFKKEKTESQYKDLTNISKKLLNNEYITPDEQQKFETLLNKVQFYGTIREGNSDSEMGGFIQWWNAMPHILYRMFTLRNAYTGEIEIRFAEKV